MKEKYTLLFFKILVFINLIISVSYFFGYNLLKLEKDTLFVNLVYFFAQYITIIYAFILNFKLFINLKENNMKEAKKTYSRFFFVLIGLCLYVYDSIIYNIIFRPIETLLSFNSIFELIRELGDYKIYTLLFFLNFYIPIRYFYLIKNREIK